MAALYMPINLILKDSFIDVSNIYEVPTMCQCQDIQKLIGQEPFRNTEHNWKDVCKYVLLYTHN